MSSTYARIQSKAGRTLELEPGAAWRAAMEAATQVRRRGGGGGGRRGEGAWSGERAAAREVGCGSVVMCGCVGVWAEEGGATRHAPPCLGFCALVHRVPTCLSPWPDSQSPATYTHAPRTLS